MARSMWAPSFLWAGMGPFGSSCRKRPLARHAIGLNWCAIGIENVGGARGKEDLTEAQLRANIALISYLKDKYPTLTTVLGHYEQDKAKQTDLWREDVPNYYHGKIDPGPTFMKGLREALTKKGLKFL